MTDPEARPTRSHDVGKTSATRIFFIILTVVALGLFAASLNQPLRQAIRSFSNVLSPVLIGAVIAYLCNPILMFFEYRLFRHMKNNSLRQGLSLFMTVLAALGTLILVGVLIIPQLYDSLLKFAANIGNYIANLRTWVDQISEKLPFEFDIDALLGTTNADTADELLQAILDKLAPLVTGGNMADKILGVLSGLLNTFKNALLGMVIAFFILASKEKRVAQVRKARAALLSESTDRRLVDFVSLADNTFGGFIYGKLLDSLVIGILTFAMLLIFDISEYNLLIAIIVGVTNVIPVFGPFIGAIPAFFIVLVTSPQKAILVLILILIIQQLDGNIIGPKILGDNTGVSSLCVIVAISICSTLWGVAGMLIGVPFFAVIIELVRRALEGQLTAKGMETDTLAYYPDDSIGNAEEEVYYEHSHLRYVYDHSRIKPKWERFRTWLFSWRMFEETPPQTAAPPQSNDLEEASPPPLSDPLDMNHENSDPTSSTASDDADPS